MLIIYIHHHHHNVQTFFFCSEKSIKKTLKFLKNPDLNDSNKYLLSTGCCSRINDGDANDIFLFTLKKISIHFFFVFAKQSPIICHTYTHKQTFWIEIASNFCLIFFSHKKTIPSSSSSPPSSKIGNFNNINNNKNRCWFDSSIFCILCFIHVFFFISSLLIHYTTTHTRFSPFFVWFTINLMGLLIGHRFFVVVCILSKHMCVYQTNR